MKWLIDNWSFLVVVICAIIAIVVYLNRFIALPSGEQLNNGFCMLLLKQKSNTRAAPER